MPACVELTQMPLQCVLAHGTERRGFDAVRRLGTPPHYPVLRVGAAEAISEESVLTKRCLYMLPDRSVLKQRPR
jgi:hypothetical protein